MAKDLPYFKFIISEWNDGDVTLCSLEAQGLFINLCSLYWSQEGNLSLAKSKRRFSDCNAIAWEELVKDHVIKISGDDIVINFLDEQFDERGKLSKTNSENAANGWKKRKINATALPSQSNPIEVASNIEENREEEKRKKKKRIEDNGAANAATIDERKLIFMEKVALQMPKFGKEMLREFFDYWTEANEGGKKMRFEMQKVFDISRRLKTWDKNNKFNGNGKSVAKVIDQQQEINALIKAEFADKGTGQGNS